MILTILFNIFAALLIAFGWLAFLRKVSIFQSIPWSKILLAFAIGCTTVAFPFVKSWWEFYVFLPDSESFLFYFLEVGIIEEACKISGFLLFFFLFRSRFDEEANALVFGGAVGLGFASVENFLYFQYYGTDLVFVRGLLSAFFHVLDTSLIAAAFCLGLRHSTAKGVLWGGGAYALISLMHGAFDYFLGIELGFLLTLGVFFLVVETWANLLNNLLNRSPRLDPRIAIDRNSLQRFLILIFFVAALIQFTAITLESGGNGWFGFLFALLIFQVPLATIVLNRITRFIIVPGVWKRIVRGLPFALRFGSGKSQEWNARNMFFNMEIKGIEFDEYPFTRRVGMPVKLRPIRMNGSRIGKEIQAVMLEKRFEGEELFYYRVHSDELQFPPDSFLLIHPKSKGKTHLLGSKVVALILETPTEKQFVEWMLYDNGANDEHDSSWEKIRNAFRSVVWDYRIIDN